MSCQFPCRAGPALPPIVLALALAACGGADPQQEATPSAPSAASSAQAGGSTLIAPLIADDGSPMPASPEAVPADRGAHTRSGRYATTQQAHVLESALGHRVLRVRVECCGSDGVERAVGIAYGLQAAHDLPDDTAVLVDAADLRQGAAAVNRLAESRLTRVWLVTH